MKKAYSHNQQTSPDVAVLTCTRLKMEINNEEWISDEGLVLVRAASCLLRPDPGDLVTYASLNGKFYITHVLEIHNSNTELSIAKAESISLVGHEVSITGSKSLNLSSQRDIFLNSVTGAVRIGARDFVTTLARNLVQICEHMICRSGHTDRVTEGLERNHAAQQIFTAEHDIKMDATRINMG